MSVTPTRQILGLRRGDAVGVVIHPITGMRASTVELIGSELNLQLHQRAIRNLIDRD